MSDEKDTGVSQEAPDSEKAVMKPPKNKAVHPQKNKTFGIKDFLEETKPEPEEEKNNEDEFAEVS